MIFCSAVKCNATDFVIVDVSQQIYSYDSLCEDMAILAAGHEDIMSYESLATTSQGRNVWLVKYGNLQADKRILITASIHAREYMTSQLVMRMLEEYVLNVDTPQADGNTYRQLFSDTCFYIMPMVNPDGVTMCQFQPGMHQLKANVNGVDLNRNFPVGFGRGGTAPSPGLFYYPGTAPLTEAETQALSGLINAYPFIACINYHSMGNVNYYGASTNSAENAKRCKALANVVSSVNGYRTKYCGDACGSFADYFYEVTDCPSVTIEIGTANPVPISQFTGIYNKNVGLWKVLAALFL